MATRWSLPGKCFFKAYLSDIFHKLLLRRLFSPGRGAIIFFILQLLMESRLAPWQSVSTVTGWLGVAVQVRESHEHRSRWLPTASTVIYCEWHTHTHTELKSGTRNVFYEVCEIKEQGDGNTVMSSLDNGNNIIIFNCNRNQDDS